MGEGSKSRPYDFVTRSPEYQHFLLTNEVDIVITGRHSDKVSAVLNEQGLISWFGIENLMNRESFRFQKCDSYGFKGKRHSPETIAVMKEKRKSQVFTPETCAKIGNALRGSTVPQERKQRISETKKNRRLTCPHCGLTGGVSNLRRYHFNNCKLRA